MRLVQESAEAKPAFTPAPEPAQPIVPVNALADVVALADARRDMQMKVSIRRYVRPVSFRPGVIEIGLTDDAPRGFASDLSKKLTEWTGARFMVSVVQGATTKTLDEAENARRDGMMADAKADPDVAAILARFPGSKIINVRIETAGASADMEGSADENLPAQPGLDPAEDDD